MESVARGTRSDSVSIALWRLPHASGLSGPFSMSVVREPQRGVAPERARDTSESVPGPGNANPAGRRAW